MNRLLGLTDGFFDDVKMLPLEERETDGPTEHSTPKRGGKRNKKRKVCTSNVIVFVYFFNISNTGYICVVFLSPLIIQGKICSYANS